MTRDNIRYYGPRDGPRDITYKDKTIKQLNETIEGIKYFVGHSYDKNVAVFFGPQTKYLIWAVLMLGFFFAFQIDSYLNGSVQWEEYMSFICFIMAIIQYWFYRNTITTIIQKEEGTRNRVYDVDEIISKNLKTEIEKELKKEQAKR